MIVDWSEAGGRVMGGAHCLVSASTSQRSRICRSMQYVGEQVEEVVDCKESM